MTPTLWGLALGLPALAGGGPRQVLVVTNADDPQSVAIADHYAVSRQLPPGHVCGLSGLDPIDTAIDFADFDAVVAPALDACLAALPDPDAIQVLVTTRGLPYRVDLDAGYVVGFEALLQVHGAVARSDGSPLAGSPQTDAGGYFAASVGNPVFVGGGPSVDLCDFVEDSPYALWYSAACALLHGARLPEPFDRHAISVRGTWDFESSFFIVSRLDGFDATDAMDLVDRGVAADGTFPTAPLMCMHGADSARGARDPECELVVRSLDAAGLAADWIDTFDGALSGQTVAGYLTGAASMTGAIAGNTYVAGALTDNLTSYGAVPTNFFCDESGETCPASESQTSVARFVRAGATGAHGAVAEPLNNVFPNASVYLFYTFGYSLGESYLFSQRYAYWQNLVLGDPLTTPYATRPTVVDAPSAVAEDQAWAVETHHPDGIAWTRAYVDDRLVAEAAGPVLAVEPGRLGSDGDTVEVYIVAEAASVEVSRPGWPTEAHTPTPGVRGWQWSTIAITAAADPDTGAPDSGTPDSADPDTDTPPEDPVGDTGTPAEGPGPGGHADKGGGCAHAKTTASMSLWAATLALLVRRRRHEARLQARAGTHSSSARGTPT